MTADILEEYAEVLAELRVRPAVIGRLVNLLREQAEWIEPRRTVEADPDPKDSPFWTCADAGDGDFVVTLNRRDFPQARFEGAGYRAWGSIAVSSPREETATPTTAVTLASAGRQRPTRGGAFRVRSAPPLRWRHQ
jgi:hypothetical protein